MRAFLPGVLFVVALLAGCTNTPGTPPGGDGTPAHPARYPLPFDTMPDGGGHDHADAAQHKLLWNYAFSTRDPLLQNQADAAGLHAIDLQNGYLFGAIYGSHGVSVDGGVQVWDVHTDPAHPREMGRWTIPGSVGGDRSIGATPDGDYVVIGTEPVDCLGHVNPAGAAVSAYLIDVRDKNRPLVADVLVPSGGSAGDPTARNPRISTHSVFVQRIGGFDYAFIFGDVYLIDRNEAGSAKLSYVSSINTGHDVYVRPTPWNATWALSADGDPGDFVAYDVTDPAHPFEMGRMKRDALSESEGASHYLHTADVAFVGNQTLVILTSEDFGDWVSPFWVLDGNPLRNVTAGQEPVELKELGEWHNPYNHTAANIRFSLHNPRVHDDGLLTISSYHAGFFQFDLRQPEFWAKPSLIAAGNYADGAAPLTVDPIESAVENQICKLGITVDAPEFMDVAVGGNGTLYFADVFMGLYTFTPTAEHPVYGKPATAESVAAHG